MLLLISQSIFSQATIQQILNNGPTKNRINIVYLSEGYTISQLPKFSEDAKKYLNYLFTNDPFKEYKRYFNAFSISVVSNDSGSDHPSQNIFRDTYFNSTYDSYGLERLITIPPNNRDSNYNDGMGKVDKLLMDLLPEYDLTLLIVNDPAYGGGASGGFYAIFSLHPSELESSIHELGHSFGELGDEYSDPYPGYPDKEEPNTTRETRKEFIKWRTWILDNTPIPTPSLTQSSSIIGLFEGAHYHFTGWYRPKLNCKMRSLNVNFCEVCKETLVRSIYGLVSPIESFSPTLSKISLTEKDTVDFNIVPMFPTNHNLNIQWFINGSPVNFEESSSLNVVAQSLGNGTHSIKVKVLDYTSLVRNDPENLLSDEVMWTLNISGVIPVELSSFTCSVLSNKDIKLEWTTLSETNNYGFEIECSSNGEKFVKIVFIQGYGTTNKPQEYSFTDNKLESGIYYYRLKQVDYDGTISYSNILSVNIGVPKEFNLNQNYPNQFNAITNIKYELPIETQLTIEIYNILGQRICTLVDKVQSPGYYTVQWNGQNEEGLIVTSGVYFYQIRTNKFVKTRKMLFVK
jgi:hypothetical protein